MVTATDIAKSQANDLLLRLLDFHRSRLGLQPGDRVEPEQFFPVDTKQLVRLLDWELEQVGMVGQSVSGESLLAKCVPSEKKIQLLSSLSEATKRFTLAHEIAHVCLHSNDGIDRPRMKSMVSGPKTKSDLASSYIERQAEIFARELLMPERAVRRQFRKLFRVDELRAASGFAAQFASRAQKDRPVNLRAAAEEIANYKTSNVTSLTDFFGVSTAAMASRLIGLHLVY